MRIGHAHAREARAACTQGAVRQRDADALARGRVARGAHLAEERGAVHGRSARTNAVQTRLAGGAEIAVVAGRAVGLHRRHAALHRIADARVVARARAAADDRRARRARARFARIAARARVAVVAHRAVRLWQTSPLVHALPSSQAEPEMGAHVPSVGAPVPTEHALHAPLHGPSQQTVSAQKVLWHWFVPVHAWPFVFLGAHVPLG